MRKARIPPEERIHRILKHLKEEREVRVSNLAREFEVPESVVRTDLEWLASIVPIGRHHGGARLEAIFWPYKETSYEEKRTTSANQKNLIASFAAKYFVKTGDRLLITPGSTCEAFVAELVHQWKDVRVITNAANFALYFAGATNSAAYLQLGGGLATTVMGFGDDDRFGTGDFFAKRAREFLEAQCAGKRYKAIISGVGFDSANGLTLNEARLVPYHRAFVSVADLTIVLLSHEKFSYIGETSACCCGVRPEDESGRSANQKRDFIIIVDTDWDDVNQEKEFEKCRAVGNWKAVPIQEKDKEYAKIAAYSGEMSFKIAIQSPKK